MAEDRRGPEYVHAHVVQRKHQNVKRNLTFAVFPLIGIGLAVLFTSVILPGRRSEDQYTRLVRAIRGTNVAHTIEYRPNRANDVILREDWLMGPRRRLEYFGGQFVAYHFSQDGRGTDYIYERGPKVLRKHAGSTLITPAIERLMTDLRWREVISTRSLPDGTLDVLTRRKRLLITMDPASGRPTRWITLVSTDRGEEVLLRTEAEYTVDPEKLKYDDEIWGGNTVDMARLPDPFDRQSTAVATLGSDVELLTFDINQYGDIFYAYRSIVDRPYIEVTDSQGHSFSPVDIYQTSRAGARYVGEQLALRMEQAPAAWPVTVTLRSKALDPRLSSRQGEVKEFTLRFDRPTCFMAPSHWFKIYVSDSPLYDYERTRHYRRTLVLQNAMRTPEGKLVDTLSGGASALEPTDTLRKDPADLQRAVTEARQTLRVRTEFDGGRLATARVYLLLIELYMALESREEARKVVEFTRGMVRDGRADSFVAAEIERAAKEQGL